MQMQDMRMRDTDEQCAHSAKAAWWHGCTMAKYLACSYAIMFDVSHIHHSMDAFHSLCLCFTVDIVESESESESAYTYTYGSLSVFFFVTHHRARR